MPPSVVAVSVALIAGLAGGLQIAINGAFGRRIGFIEASAFASIVTVVTVNAFALAYGQRMVPRLGEALRAPPWLWLGGAMSAVLIISVTFAAPRIGTLATGGLLIAGQLLVAVLADRFGWFGLDRIPFTVERALGLTLLAGGAYLVLRR